MGVINHPPWDHRRFTIYSELFCGMLLTFLPIFFRITSLSLPAKQPWKNMAKCVIIWINKSRLYCQNKAGYTETECIFHGTNCVPSYRSAQTHTCLLGTKTFRATGQTLASPPPIIPTPLTKLLPFWPTTFSNAFSWKKMIKFRFKVHWNLFPGVQLTINQHWLR